MWHLSSIEHIPDDLPVCSSRSWIEAASQDNGQPVVFQHEKCMFPFVVNRRSFLRVLEGSGAERRSAAGFIGIEAGEDPPQITHNNLPENIDLIDLRRVPQSQVHSLFPKGFSRHISLDGAHYVLPLKGTWEDFLKNLKKKFRQNVQASRNRLGRDFLPEEIQFKNILVNGTNWQQVIEWWQQIDCRSWQGKDKLTALHHPKKMEFLRRVIKGNLKARVFLLFIKNKPVAIRWFFIHGSSGLFYSIQFDTDFNRYRPGHLLTAEALTYCFENNIIHIDFGHGDSGHKKDWLAERVPLVRLMVPLTWKGKVFILYQKMRWLAGRTLKRT